MKVKKIAIIISLFFLLSSCTCGTPLRVTPIQRSDKKLACKDIILEINEAEHYRDEAVKEQGIGMGEALMPICWVSGFVDGEQGVKKANARIDYLGNIYDLMDCGGKGQKTAPAQSKPAAIVAPIAQPRRREEPKPEPVKMLPKKSGYYKMLSNAGPNKMHEHMDKNGKLYIHSHPHPGPHVHLEDMKN